MEDYELGKLAEELIQSRYGDQLKSKDSEISKLKEELDKIKVEKTYLKISSSIFGMNASYRETYISIDDITDELKLSKDECIDTGKKLLNSKDELKLSKELSEKISEKLETVAKVNLKLDRFIHRSKFASFIYRMWSEKQESPDNGWG